jgi:hypothetical protein
VDTIDNRISSMKARIEHSRRETQLAQGSVRCGEIIVRRRVVSCKDPSVGRKGRVDGEYVVKLNFDIVDVGRCCAPDQ